MSRSQILIISQHTPTINHLTALLTELDYQVLSAGVGCSELLRKEIVMLILYPIQEQDIAYLSWIQDISRKHCVPYLFLSSSLSPSLLEEIKTLPPPVYCAKMGNKDSLYAYLEIVKYHFSKKMSNDKKG